MSDTEQNLHPVEALESPRLPTLPNRFRSFLRDEHSVQLGDITARPYDRATIAPFVADFVLYEVRDNPAAHVDRQRLTQRIHALSLDREVAKDIYAQKRAKAEANIRRLLPYVPEMQVTSDLQELFKGDEVSVVIHDVAIALGGLRHPMAKRNAAIASGGEPPNPKSRRVSA